MKYYIEITLMNSDEFTLFQIWSKVYTQLHIAFVEHADEDGKISFGVSFPEYRMHEKRQIGWLGEKIRVFAHTEQELHQLDLGKWLERLTDYAHITQAREVPQVRVTGFAHYFRINPRVKLGDRIAHQAKRLNISFNEAQQHFKAYTEQFNIEPYINLKSLSARREENVDRPYRLYIGKAIVDRAQNGKFGTYGLSRSSTVPEF